jgi:peroxiredoxin
MKSYLLAALIFIFSSMPAFAGLKIGEKAPPFTSASVSGEKISISSYQNKKSVLLYFWDADFHICRLDLLKLNKQYASYSRKGIQIISVNIRKSSSKRADAFIKTYKIKIPLLMDSDEKISELYHINGIVPTTFLINKIGKIVYLYQGSFSVHRQINPQIAALTPKMRETPIKNSLKWKVFQIPNTGLEASIPQEWKQKPFHSNSIFIFLYKPFTKKWLTSRFHLIRSRKFKLAKLVKAIYRAVKSQNTDVKFFIKPTAHANFPQHITFALTFKNPKQIKILMFGEAAPVGHKKTFLLVSFMNPLNFKKYKPLLQEVFASLRRVK